MVKYFIAGLFCLLSLFISAQDQFLVYSMKGKVSVVTNNAENMARTGTMLTVASMVNIPEDGAVTFICNGGRMFSITKAGSYSLTSFRDSCYGNNNILLTSYSKFVWDQLTKELTELGRNRRDYFPNYEVRIRDHWDIWVDQLFDTVNYSGNGDFPLSWKPYSNTKKFRFSLYQPGNTASPFYSITVNKLKILFTDFLDKIKQGSSCYWGVSLSDEESNELRLFNYVSGETYDSVLTSFKKLKPLFEAPPEEAFRIAFMLENAHYFAEAQEYYKKAAILDPPNTLYWSTLMWFKKVYEIDNR